MDGCLAFDRSHFAAPAFLCVTVISSNTKLSCAVCTKRLHTKLFLAWKWIWLLPLVNNFDTYKKKPKHLTQSSVLSKYWVLNFTGVFFFPFLWVHMTLNKSLSFERLYCNTVCSQASRGWCERRCLWWPELRHVYTSPSSGNPQETLTHCAVRSHTRRPSECMSQLKMCVCMHLQHIL